MDIGTSVDVDAIALDEVEEGESTTGSDGLGVMVSDVLAAGIEREESREVSCLSSC